MKATGALLDFEIPVRQNLPGEEGETLVPLPPNPGAKRGLAAPRCTLLAVALILGAGSLDGQTFSEFPIPTSGSEPQGIATGSDGALWFTEISAGKIGRVTVGGNFTEFTIPTAGSAPDGIAAGPDGALWFTETNAGKIGRITIAGVVSEFSIPTAASSPFMIAAGSDGALWFTETGANQIGRIDTEGSINEFAIPTASSTPLGITAGPDGALWFTEFSVGRIGRITTAGVVSEFAVPTSTTVFGIAAGPDGALWFTEAGGTSKIGRITTAGAITESTIPTAGSDSTWITAGPDGALWFVEKAGNKIGRITTGGTFSEFAIPTAGAGPESIFTGPDGALWFAERVTDKIGRITAVSAPTCLGPICEYASPGSAHGIAAGPDGVMWFTDYGSPRVFRIDTQGNPLPQPSYSGALVGFGYEERHMTVGSDGWIWYTAPFGMYSNQGALGHCDPKQLACEAFELPDPTSRPIGIASDSNRYLWVGDPLVNFRGSLWRIDTRSDSVGTATQFEVDSAPSPPCSPFATVVSGAYVWFSCSAGQPDGSGRIGRFLIPDGPADLFSTAAPVFEITAARDGTIWFTESSGSVPDAVSRIDPSGKNYVRFPVPPRLAGVNGISPGPVGDSSMWVSSFGSSRFFRIGQNGQLMGDWPTPTGLRPHLVTVGPDSKIWFAEADPVPGKIAKLDPALVCQLTAVVTVSSVSICAGGSTTLSGSEQSGSLVTCTWTPTTGLANPNACVTTASPSVSTTYLLTVTSSTDPSCSSPGSPVTITVTAAGSTPTITAPDTAYAGQTGLTASTGDPFRAFTWTITNGTITSGQGTSTITFTAGSPGPLALTAVDSSGGCASGIATKSVFVLGSFSVTLPVVAHVVGQDGVLFLTDVDIDNPNAFSVTATATLEPSGGGAPSQATLTFSPFETKSIHDVVLTLFALSDAKGGMRIETFASNGQTPPQLLATSRTYDESPDGSFGLAIPGDQNAVPQTTPAYVTGIQLNPDFRTNLGGINISSATETFQIVLRGPDGTVLGTSSTKTLAPFEQFQESIKDLFPGVFSATSGAGQTEGVRSAAPTSGMTAEYQPMASSTVPVGYGNLADNQSGDLTYFGATPATQDWYLPVLSLIRGQGNSLFKSELDISNTSDSDANVTVTFLERDRDNRPQGRQKTVPVHAHQTVSYSNALSDLFGITDTPGTFGAVKVEADENLAVSGRIYTNSPLTAGTVGQQVDPIPKFYSRAKILGLKQDSKFRSNVGLLNPTQATVSVTLTLFRSGSKLGTATVSVPPLSMTQQRLSTFFPGIAFPAGETMSLQLDSQQAIGGYGIIADNTSQDLTTSPAVPLLSKSTSGSAGSPSKQ